MQFITKETLDKYVGDKSIIELDVILDLIVHEFGISMPLESKPTDEQRKKMTKAISENEEIIEQIRSARTNRDETFSSYSGDEDDFDKLVLEVNDGRL
ncbi:MAG: hypothetical protein WDZ91_04700 [Paenibacillaceae bacterium]